MVIVDRLERKPGGVLVLHWASSCYLLGTGIQLQQGRAYMTDSDNLCGPQRVERGRVLSAMHRLCWQDLIVA